MKITDNIIQLTFEEFKNLPVLNQLMLMNLTCDGRNLFNKIQSIKNNTPCNFEYTPNYDTLFKLENGDLVFIATENFENNFRPLTKKELDKILLRLLFEEKNLS